MLLMIWMPDPRNERLTWTGRHKILPCKGTIMTRAESLSAVEAAYLASACLEASRKRERRPIGSSRISRSTSIPLTLR